MENMNNQGKRPDQYENSARFASYSILGMIILLIIITLLGSCTAPKECCKKHVITEWDGDKEIRWYTCTSKPGDVASDLKWGNLKPIFKNNGSKRTNKTTTQGE